MANSSANQINTRQIFVAYRYYIPGGIALVAAVGLLLFNFVSVSQILNLRSEIEQEEKALLNVNNRLARLEELSAGELEVMRSQVNTALPPEKPVFEVLSAVNGVAVETGVKVVDLSTRPGSLATASARVKQTGSSRSNKSKAQPKKEFETLNVTLELEGSFNALNNFFNGIVELAPLMDLETVRITSQGKEEQAPSFSGEVDLIVYWNPDQSIPTGAGSIVEITNEQRKIFNQIESLAVYESTNSAEI